MKNCNDQVYCIVVASKDFTWEHVSVSLSNRCPNWPEMCYIKISSGISRNNIYSFILKKKNMSISIILGCIYGSHLSKLLLNWSEKVSEWILVSVAKPPTCHSVLAYVIQYHDSSLKDLWDWGIYSAWYDDEIEKCWYLDEPESTWENHHKKLENNETRVICWTLLPGHPNLKTLKKRWGKDD